MSHVSISQCSGGDDMAPCLIHMKNFVSFSILLSCYLSYYIHIRNTNIIENFIIHEILFFHTLKYIQIHRNFNPFTYAPPCLPQFPAFPLFSVYLVWRVILLWRVYSFLVKWIIEISLKTGSSLTTWDCFHCRSLFWSELTRILC